MELSDFLTLIQLAAGLNIAFVAVEASRGYTRILSGNVFNINNLLNTSFEDIKDTIFKNRKTLDGISSTEVNGKSTTNKIEGVKREYEKLEKKIEDVITNIKNTSDLKCNFKCFSGLSLMMFFFCFTLLFLNPFKVISLVILITLLILIYSIIGWIFDESRFFCSLKFVIWEFVGGVIICVILWLCIRNCDGYKSFVESFNNATIIIAALLPFVNFVAFFLKMIWRVQNIRKDIKKHLQNLSEEIAPINGKVDKLRTLEELKMEMREE